MKIEYQGHSKRIRQTLELRAKVVSMYTSGVSASEIAKTFNKSRPWVYWNLRMAQTNKN